MIDAVKEYIQNMYNEIYSRVDEITEVFNSQFGEDNVEVRKISLESSINKLIERGLNPDGDLEYIRTAVGVRETLFNFLNNHLITYIIRFPEVRVTNENDKYIDIKDLFVKVMVSVEGRCMERFKMTRATLSYEEFIIGYLHSHLHTFSGSSVPEFSSPCLGDGPIRRTVYTLMEQEYNINFWSLFAYELSKYVAIESLAGGPYIRLESVGRAQKPKEIGVINYVPSRHYKFLDPFIKYCADNELFKFKYVRNQYVLGESFESFFIRISNAFIKWCDETSKNLLSGSDVVDASYYIRCGILDHYIVSGGKIYGMNERTTLDAINNLQGQHVLFFKGQDIRFNIITSIGVIANNSALLLSKEPCAYIISKILSLINYNYGRKQYTKTGVEAIPSGEIVFI